MKNLIFGSKENLSLEEKYVEALALIAGVLAVLFLPTSFYHSNLADYRMWF